MRKYKNPKCKTCMYRAADYYENGCDYILVTGHSRGCPVEECDKYERKARKRKKPVMLAKKGGIVT